MILKTSVPSKIKVNFRGSGKELISLVFRNKYIELDLNQITQSATYAMTVDMIKGIPPELSVIPLNIVQPDSIKIELDQFVEKKVPIYPNITLIPLDGYSLVGDIIMEPDWINIQGPKSLVNAIDFIPTQEKIYKNIIKEISGKINLMPPSFETLQYSSNTTHFSAEIQRIGERIISDISIQVTNVPENMNVTAVPSTLSLKLQGGVKILSKITKEDITASINFLNRNRYERTRIPAMIQVPKDISFSDVIPPFFELIVER